MDKFFGIELECVVNSELASFQQRGYHNTDYGAEIPHWAVTSDSSISRRNLFKSEDAIEFVCERTPFEEWDKVFDAFKKSFVKKAGREVELNEVIDFNTSCGAHVHFSSDTKKENSLMTMKIYKKLRTAVLKRVETDLPAVYRAFKAQYFRTYSRVQSGEMIDKNIRESEINYTRLEKGVEWRGFNLLGVETWEELHDMIKIALEELAKILDEINHENFEEVVNFLIPKEDFDRVKDQISVVVR